MDRIGRVIDDQYNSFKGSRVDRSLVKIGKILEGSVYSTLTLEVESITVQPQIKLYIRHVQYPSPGGSRKRS